MAETISVNPSLFLRPEELRRAADLMFLAHRDFTALADDLLSAHNLGRAHQRALHFISREDGITVGALILTLKVTKQSLNRVLKELQAAQLVDVRVGASDRRQRTLHLTQAGGALTKDIEQRQHKRIVDTYRAVGPEAIASFWETLIHLIEPEEQVQVRQRLGLNTLKAGGRPDSSF